MNLLDIYPKAGKYISTAYTLQKIDKVLKYNMFTSRQPPSGDISQTDDGRTINQWLYIEMEATESRCFQQKDESHISVIQ